MLQSWSRHLLAFPVFAALYFLPTFALSSGSLSSEQTRRALRQALASPTVLQGLAQNLATHMALVLALYAGLALLAQRWVRRTGVRMELALTSTLGLAWIWLVAGNGLLYPHSAYSAWLRVAPHAVTFTLASAVLAVMAIMARPVSWPVRSYGWGAAGSAALGTLVAMLMLGAPPPVLHAKAAPQRNVIIVGVDSLSAPLLARESRLLPQLTALEAQGTRHSRAYTPIGRTFPAWVDILSGRPTSEHGALFNLRGIDQVKRQDLVGQELRSLGYRSVYAIDERRFNNIDESFGFDAVVGPSAGVLDFALQPFNDTPLTNPLLQTRLAHWLLPYSRLNAASAANYDADGFVDEIARAIDSPAPVFLAVHFLSGHYPFSTRHASTAYPAVPNPIRAHHVEALTAVDAQVGRLMNRLAEAGRLEDTLVILLSDHGEAVGEDEPVRDLDGQVNSRKGYGHGADLLSEHQNRIVLTVMHYRNGKPAPALQGTSSELVSLLDVRPAIERFVHTGEARIEPGANCIDVETELRLASASDYRRLEPGRVAAEGADLYEIDGQGRMRLRESVLPALVARKDVGLRCADRLTIFRPSDGLYRAYRLADGKAPEEFPARAEDVERVRNYRALLLGAASAGQDSAAP